MAKTRTGNTGSVIAETYLAAWAVLDDPSSTEEQRQQARDMLQATWEPQIGDRVLIHTGTVYSTGVVVNITPDWIALVDAASIRATGALGAAVMDAKTAWDGGDVYPEDLIIYVARGGIIQISKAAKRRVTSG